MRNFVLRIARSPLTGRGTMPAICLLFLFVLFRPAPVQAQSPPPEGCPAADQKGTGEGIKCRLDAILAKNDKLIATVKEKFKDCTGARCGIIQEHLKKMEGAQSRAKGQHGRHDKGNYDEINTTRKAKCKGNKNCLQNPEDLELDDKETPTGNGDDLADQLDAIAEDMDVADALLSPLTNGLAAPATSRVVVATAFKKLYDYTDPTVEPNYPAWLHVADNTKALIPVSFAATAAADGAKKAAFILQAGCQQDIFGTNTSIVCLILDVVAVALDGVAKLLAFNLSDATAWDAKGAYMRAADLSYNMEVVHGDVTVVAAAVGDAKAAVDILRARAASLKSEMALTRQRIVTAQNQIIQLLLTPEGQRVVPAAILTCDGVTTACPLVKVTCSPTTGVCSYNK